MNAAEAKLILLSHVRVDRADVEAAKHAPNSQTGRFELLPFARERADTTAGHPDKYVPLWQEDPSSSLQRMAEHIIVHLAVFEAAWDLIAAGVLRQAGAVAGWRSTMGWTTVGPNRGGHSAAEDLPEVAASYPEWVLRPAWRREQTVLADADLYVLALEDTRLDPQILEALRQAHTCFHAGLYVPALAMLDAASEGAWVEVGTALVDKLGSDPGAAQLAATLADPGRSIRTKCDAVVKLFESKKALQQASGIGPAQLRDTLQWSGLIRDGRNVLHWNVDPIVPNDYATVAAYLLAAITHLRRLDRLRTFTLPPS